MDEANKEQVYNHSQFENLRKFWDLGSNSNTESDVEKKSATRSHKYSVLSNSHKHKESSDIKSFEEKIHEAEVLQSHKKIPEREEMEKLNSKYIPQVLPDETTLLWRPPRTSIHQLPGNESSKENVGKNTEWFVTPVTKKDKDYSDQEIEESIVKASILSRNYKDTFNDSLQKLLAEASLPAIQPPGGKAHVKQELEPGFSEAITWSPKTDLTDVEKAKQPKEIINEHVDKTIVPPKVEHNTFNASLDRLLKEASEISLSPLQTNMESVTTGTTSDSEESRFLGKVMERSHNTLDKRGIIASFPEEGENLVNAAVSQKVQSGKCQLNTENLIQMAVDASPHCHRKDSFGNKATFYQDLPFPHDAHLVPQDRALPSQREISETVERVILPPRTVLNDINATLKKLLREVQLSYSAGGQVFPGEVETEFPEGIQASGSPQVSLGVISPRATTIIPDRKDSYSFNSVPDKTHIVGPYVAPTNRVAQMSPSEQSHSSSDSTVALYSKELSRERAGNVKETIIQPKLQLLEFNARLEKLLEEITEHSPSNCESNSETLSPLKLIGSTEEPRQVASEFHPEEIKETVEKSEAPLKTESVFDNSLQKLLHELSEAPPYQHQMSVKEETPETSSQSEKAKFLDTVPRFYWTASEASEVKVKSNVLKSQLHQCDKELRGDKDVTDLSLDLCSPECGVESSGTSQLYVDNEIETVKTTKSSEDRNRESKVAGKKGNFQEPDFQETPESTSVSRNSQPIPLLMNQENPTKASKVELFLASSYKTEEKEEEKGFSDSDFSDGNNGSNTESWRTTSSSEGEPSPVLKTVERNAARKMPSQSLEDISSDSSNQAKVDNLPEELVRSAEDDQKADQEPDTNECVPGISTVPSQPGNQFSHPDKLKRMSKSVPAFLQDEVSGSVMSVYSGDFGNLEVKGNIQFAIDYVDSLKELHVFVAQCKDLAAADVKKQRSDPYVKTYLLPDKGKMGKKKTFVLKKTLNPVYNEILRYKIEKQILKTQKLNVSVWHRDTFKRNSFLGEVELDLETWDWDNKQNKQLKWYPLKRKTAPVALEAENRGEMKLALQYVPEPNPGKKLPTTGEVHIWVKECLDLPLLRGSHLNSFVKCTILPDTSRKSRQKTRAVGKTTSPVFNHTMVYDGFRPEDLTEACVELTVWDHYKLTNQFLGGLRIGFGTGKSYGTEVDWMDSTSEEVALWEKMVESPNTWIEATLPLRMLLIAKISK
ncbi:PREDICTED: synaptotagmin-like protein 2 isoform X2 [Chrysochloris asiatica]|uniref:Synaptotagmin-like protein 2 n=2 Tax=Chrysochloris asiatica TaxID=185453 RepID=A0A9B0TNT5_CHRAS|nr:PREDICTED: synaptotagmin-like protein 2 isoform X2 [Chrysochloris asiatica]